MTNAEESKSAPDKRLSDDIPTLEAEVAEMTLAKEKCEQSIRDFRAAEDFKKGIYHHTEIYELQQEKLRLEVDIKFRTNKINRINLGMEDMGTSEGIQNGFLF